MIQSETQIRVCYGDTDQMGVVYYGNYARFYEIGRNDLIRNIGISYKELENRGIILPAHSMSVRYLLPARYDEVLTIRTIIKRIPKVKFEIHSEIYNEEQVLINSGVVNLAFVDAKTMRPCRIPDYLLQLIEKQMI